MTIEAGALAIRITETGADQVLQKLGTIDAKARALGAATQNIKFNVPSATGVNNQMQLLSANFTKVAQAANTAAPAIDKASQATGRATAASKTAAMQIGDQILGYYSLGQVVNVAIRIFDEFNAAADRQAVGQMRLKASAQLTGSSLATVTKISADAQQKFKLSSADAADLTQSIVRLASASGDVGKSGALMTSWMDLAAAQGLPLNRIIDGINSALAGNDDALNRLGIMDPSAIYKKWADSVGAHNGQLTQQQKMLAIVNELMEQGAKARGAYKDFLETVPGKQLAWNSALEQFNAHIGAAGGPTRAFAYDIGTTLVNSFVAVDAWLDRYAVWLRKIAGMKPGALELKVNGANALDSDPNLEQSIKAGNLLIENEKAEKLASEKAAREEAKREAERERKRLAKERADAIAKAMEVPTLGFQELSHTYHGPAGPRFPATVGVGSDGKMKGVKTSDLAKATDGVTRLAKEWDKLGATIQSKRDLLVSVVSDIAGSVTSAFGDAFSAAFSGDDNFFAALGKSLLKSLGNILMQIGASMITYGAIMTPLLGIPGPWQVLGLGAAASAAAGIGLMALGAGMGAIGGKGGGNGGGGGAGHGQQKHDPNEFEVAFDPDHKRRGSAVTPGSRSIDSSPLPEARPVVNIGTINSLHPDNREWQRVVATTYNNARNSNVIKARG